ncbi:LuxR C-terminal-related transcriptional regulator [Streptomyces sp. NPDC127072]|uniref:LuxR C-terminal-related transcriptional regulator n=1 Tax=Streptomyces sp. NPDC127072 TaxID=3347129 RepID=UPI003664EE6E
MAVVIESRSMVVVGQAAADDIPFRDSLKADIAPALVLLDRAIREGDVLEFAKTVSVASAAALTVVFGVRDAQEAEACLRAGATGVLAADITATQLVEALETVLRGGLVVILENAPDGVPPPSGAAGAEATLTLSGREREILVMLASGREGAAIADELGISPLTVKTHIANMLTKIGVRQRGHLIAFAYETGIVVPGLRSGRSGDFRMLGSDRSPVAVPLIRSRT